MKNHVHNTAESFLVDLGNSETGALGLCIRVTMPHGSTKEQVIEHVRAFLQKNESYDGTELLLPGVTDDSKKLGIEYVRLFINPDHISVTHISGLAETVELHESEKTA